MLESIGKKKELAWWCLIFVCIALMIKSPWQDWRPEKTAEDDERVTLAVLELQGRLLIGAAQAQPKDLEKKLAEMEGWAMTDQTAIAVAAVRFFIDPEGNGKWRALALVKARLKVSTENEDQNNHHLLDNVRKVLDESESLSDEERQQIRSQMGWFGKILLAAAAEEGSPDAEELAALKKQSLMMIGITGFLFMSVFLGALLGVALLVVGLLQMKSGQLKMVGVAVEIPSQPYLAAFALYLALMVSADFLSVAVNPLIASVGMFVSIAVAFSWPRIRGLGWRDTLRGFGWRRGKGVFREMGAGIVGYVAMAPVFAIGFSATLILIFVSGLLVSQGADAENIASRPVTHPIVAWVAEGDWKVKFAVLFLASGLAPLFEETMFRGALYGVFRKRWGFVISGLASGFIFAAIHPQGLLAIPALTAMGFGFAMIREWRGTLIASMTAHSLHNGILISALLLALS